MGTSSSSTIVEPQDVVGEPAPTEFEKPAIAVQYGPNIISKLLGYDERSEQLSQTARELYAHIATPSNENKRRAQKLVSDVHAEGAERGRATVNLSTIENEMMDDIEYKVFLHKKTYGVRNIQDAEAKFSLSSMDSVCDEYKRTLENCLSNKNNADSSIPYYNDSLHSLSCSKQMGDFSNCVTRKLSEVY